MKLKFYTKAAISPQWQINKADIIRWGKNMLKFSAPMLVVFFALLKEGIPVEKAWPVALLTLYGSLMDLFTKFKDGKQ